MIEKHFDVVALGRSPGVLAAAALLARRSFTVLVLGHGQRPAAYRLGRHVLLRRAFTFLSATSPVWRRVLAELAQSQTFRRRLRPVSPMLQALLPASRLDLPADLERLEREIDREMPEVKRTVLETYAGLARVNAAADEVFERDLVWPPGSFWERRETSRHAARLPHVRAEPDADLLVELPRGHPFRQVVHASAQFATNASTSLPPFALARLHGAWTRGVYALARGEDELVEFLLERVEAHGGVVRITDRAIRLRVRRGLVAAVELAGDDEVASADFLLTDGEGEEVAGLAGGEGIHKRALREWPKVSPALGRFVVTLVARGEGVPRALGPEVLIVPAGRADPRRPALHLQRHRAADLAPEGPGDVGDDVVLVVEALLPPRGPLSLVEARQVVLDLVHRELPFLQRHLLVVDSVHDGAPVWIYENGKRRLVERAELRGAGTASEPMQPLYEIDPPGYLGLSGEPIRGPIDRVYLAGPTVLPALGQEGLLLAGWGAARLITRSDRRRERMRREMWSKIEIG